MFTDPQGEEKKEETCSKYAGSAKFNGIPRERKPAIPIKSYKYQCREHMIRSGMWDVFYLLDPFNIEKRWDLILHQSRFTLDSLKCHVESLQEGSEQINMWFRTWHGQEYTWGILCQILFFRRYSHWCHWQQPDMRSLLPPWLHLYPIPMMIWRILLPTPLPQ